MAARGNKLTQRRDAPAPQASGCLSEANPKGRKGPRGAEGTEKVRLGEYINEFNCRNRDGKVDSVFSVTNSRGFVPSTEYFNKEVFSKTLTTYKVVLKGDFAYNPSRINVGSIGLYDNNERGIVSPLYVTFRADAERIDFRFLLSFLKSAIALRQIRNLTAGSVRDSLKFSALCKLQLPLPTIVEQKRIAGELDKICELKKNAETRLEKLDLLVKSRFVEMFGDFATNQNQWPLVSFDDVAEIEGGLTTDFLRYSNCPHIGIDSIEKDTGALKGYRTVEEDKLTSGKYHFTSRHIIYSKIRPNLNKVAVPTFEGLCSADAYAILPRENVERLFLAFVMRSKYFLDYIIPLSGRSGMPKANQMQVRGFHFPLPPLALQREFAAFVEMVDKLKDVAKKSVEQMDVLYRAKLQEYFG